MALLISKKFCSNILNHWLAPVNSQSKVRYLSITQSTLGLFRSLNEVFELKKDTSIKQTSPNGVVPNIRCFSTSPKMTKRKDSKAQEGLCPSKATKSKEKSKKSWSLFSAKQEKHKDDCKNKEAIQKEREKECLKDCIEFENFKKRPEPDLSHLGGTIYKTCGPAYILQKEKVSQRKLSDFEIWEDKMVDKIESHPDVKNFEDPMPEFKSVGQRLLDLAEKKLHPFYKKYLTTPKPPAKLPSLKYTYKSVSGPISADDIPSRFKFNRECLDRKNIFADFKRVEPPRQLLAKILEIQLNEKPTLEKKIKDNDNQKE